jgi:hypothetical protein
MVLLSQQQQPGVPRSNASSSHAPHTIAPPVASPAPTRRWWSLCLHLYAPDASVKSRRGAPKRVNTEGFACPNRKCPYSGITDARIHALVGDGTHGQAERIQTFRCQACHITFSARRDTPLYRLKTPSRQVAVGVSALGSWAGPFRCRAGLRLPASHHHEPFYLAAFEHAQALHEHSFCNLQFPHLQLDELRTRLRSSTQVLWLWLAIDPCTKLIPVLQLGPRTQNMAHTVIHSLRQILAAFLPAALHQ